MKKMRAIRDDWTEEDVLFLASLGINAIAGDKWSWVSFEEDERYFEIKKRCGHRWGSLSEVFYWEYSQEEFDSSEYYLLQNWNCCGYPQPESNFKYKSVSFDVSKICFECGCGRIQTNDLHVKKVSKHGFWTFFSWLVDEFFVSEKVYHEVFAPHGIEKRTVIKGGKILEGIFQLVIPVIDESLDLSKRKHWLCPVCGEIKYDIFHKSYPFFPLHENPLPGIYKTKEYFDAGQSHQSQHSIILSKDVAEKLIKSKDLKKEWLIPCKRM